MNYSFGRTLTSLTSLSFGVILVALIAGCQKIEKTAANIPFPVQYQGISDQRLVNAANEPHNWLSHGRTYKEQRYSPLKQISLENVDQLGLSWAFDLEGTRGLEATPIVVDGIMYFTGTWSRVYALNALTGELLWKYDPKVPPEWAVHLCCDVVNRGVAVWGNQVYLGTLDGRLLAINAKNGALVWEVKTTPDDMPYSITGAPRVVKGNVIIGNGGGEFGVRGYVSAYDAKSGQQKWRFFTVPGDPAKPFEDPILEMAAKTWKGEWWKLGGGGTVWDSMSYDPELDLLYIGVGNGSPWNQQVRSPGGGDNLFLSSIVAVKPDTGKYVWHYQTTPGESWDYTAAQQMVLAELEIEGKTRKVIMQAPKNGFFYVLDRETGEFISGKPFVKVSWATHIDNETGRPAVVEGARYLHKNFMGFPSPFGGHNWHSMSFNPDTGLVYIPAMDLPFNFQHDEKFEAHPLGVNIGIDGVAAGMPEDVNVRKAIKAMLKGHLLAWDPIKQQAAWSVTHKTAWNGGTLTTAGSLVFQGNGEGKFIAYDAQNGQQVWSFDAQTGIVAAPVSYSVNNEQYVAILAGWGGIMPLLLGEAVEESAANNTNRLLVFRIGGDKQLTKLNIIPRSLNPPPNIAPLEDINYGRELYQKYCFNCHGDTAVAGGVLPDLRNSPFITNADLWQNVVLGGALSAKGMVSFKPVLSDKDAEDIRSYVIKRAHDQWQERQSK
ncbi:PQQ-dependent dehydrogenase, methanol/ethanol family [Paraglaciecola arctica]|uniref:Alcohol dehydrogenase [cytochrome c] n=1 Tax=Paraglaciecola arctica BSs20135 TaxID=493475 RepID=K6YKK4_9ALTE|nr:PQQ-dependent dehydrogenase, methanol/ethanol family [Paraglaciecola arctica]GAC18707.1 alcohol dehydrogenase [cytochrome c] [Paraglaciecola arctica BSs20135]